VGYLTDPQLRSDGTRNCEKDAMLGWTKRADCGKVRPNNRLSANELEESA